MDMNHDDQLELPFHLNETKLEAFLTRWIAIEEEEDRLREVKRTLKEDYQDDFPMRGILTAIKVVRAQRKLADHPKEPMRRVHQSHLESLIDQHLNRSAEAIDDLTLSVVKYEE